MADTMTGEPNWGVVSCEINSTCHRGHVTTIRNPTPSQMSLAALRCKQCERMDGAPMVFILGPDDTSRLSTGWRQNRSEANQ